jgi:uncharacterized protein (DUF1919 family)
MRRRSHDGGDIRTSLKSPAEFVFPFINGFYVRQNVLRGKSFFEETYAVSKAEIFDEGSSYLDNIYPAVCKADDILRFTHTDSVNSHL